MSNMISPFCPILLDIKKKLIMLGHMFCFCNGTFYFHNIVKYYFL